ncbi:hypothetical protein QFZ87_001512 [Bacillus sp. SLBN-46]|uniref:glucosamine inositolphosphorylceramide transferase family protein n=1 Tax=Bacillus sp. SLBN-46 TaxID=3042283 RepID=UPI0028588DE6|nr:hypothetical protein [Bacillus sp. SLBN-46]MDR6121915.1 hypothetical protein [Bacillus sp. SLBN-46]
MDLKEKKLKVGIILDSLDVPKWIGKIITDLFKIDFVVLKIAYKSRRDNQYQFNKKNNYNCLYKKYCNFDYKYYSTKVKENAFEKMNLEEFLDQLSNNADLFRTDSINLSEVEIETIKNDKFDVVIQFGARELLDKLVGISKYGIWYYPHDSFGEGYIYEPSFFRSMFHKNTPLEITLNTIMNDSQNSKIIYKSQSSVTKGSLFIHSNQVYWKSAEFIKRKLYDLYEGKLVSINESEGKSKQKEYKKVKNVETINLFLNLTIEKVKSRLYKEQWFLAYKNNMDENFKLIKPPADRFYADPFIIKKDNRTFIFFEEFIYSKGKGDISVFEIDPESNTNSKPVTILDKPYHLSYPFLYEWEDEIYMIPETSGNRTVEIYKATKFPYEWELEKVLIDNINAVDATVIHYNNKFWMFANVFVDGSSSLDELHIFYSESLLGEWKPHLMNPVVSNASSARPAGNIFLKDGKLIRPSQDCSFSYGHSVKFNEIVELTEENYNERLQFEMKPDWLKNNKGTHTYNFNEDYEVIDGRMMKSRIFK